MIFIQKPDSDPYFNLAAEEYIVKNIQDEVFMLWQNNDCLVIGKHQLTYAEINLCFIKKHQIPVIRRISGGGTVFQGRGNLNYSFVTNSSGHDDKVNFEKYTSFIRSYLEMLGLQVNLKGKSSLAIQDFKISGNAAHLYRNRVLHHGTILFDADIELINEAIKSPVGRYTSKAVTSNRATIANIRSFLKEPLSQLDFYQGLKNHVSKKLHIEVERTFTNDEFAAIQRMATEKYQSDAWNYDYSPEYSYQAKVDLESQVHEFQLTVSKGRFSDAQLVSNVMKFKTFTKSLIGIPASFKSLQNHLSNFFSQLSEEEINQIACQLL